MQKTVEKYNVNLSNIPILNLRSRFINHYHFMRSLEIKVQLSNFDPKKGIETPYLTWYGWPEELFTLLLRETIMGLEAYIPAATKDNLGCRGLLNEDNLKILRSPFSASRSASSAYYNVIPGLFDEKLSLCNHNQKLWLEIKEFYKEIRNPLFHGMELSDCKLNSFNEMFDILMNVYKWLDEWYDPSIEFKNEELANATEDF